MLVLDRSLANGSNTILLRRVDTGEVIRVILASLRPGRAKIGIEADQHWRIIREELLDEEETK